MRRFSLLACFALLAATVLASLHSYRAAETEMSRDLDQALLLTMERKSAEYITPDTVRTYRSFIKSPLLRQCATLSYCLPDEQRTSVCSRKMMLRQGGNRYYLRGYANCSMAAVFSLSDQRLPMMLCLQEESSAPIFLFQLHSQLHIPPIRRRRVGWLIPLK